MESIPARQVKYEDVKRNLRNHRACTEGKKKGKENYEVP
jgi:hypothetical protein